MKVPPKRKGNLTIEKLLEHVGIASMKVPPKRKGNGKTIGEKLGSAMEPQ